MKGYISLILIVFSTSCGASPDCDSFDDCFSCTKHDSWSGDNCRWCPLDQECHAYASLQNTCREEQNTHVSWHCSRQTLGNYSSETAYTATLLSALAYSDNPAACVNSILPTGGFELHYAVGQKCEDLPLFEYDECYAFTAVSHVKKTIVLAFRGTVTEEGNKQLYDEIVSVLLKPKEHFIIGGEVQVYFKKAFNKLSPCVHTSINELVSQNPDYDVIVTGHSLGGAIASLSAAALIWRGIVPSNKLSLYTFGMPRVGDKGYALKHDEIVNNSWRVVHARDIVPHTPTCNLITGCRVTADGPYHHGTEIFYPEIEMTKSSRYIQCKGDEDDHCSDGLVTDHWCLDLSQCIEYHKIYFEIPVGTYCRERGAGTDRKRRGISRSLMWEKFSSKFCRRINLNESSVFFGAVVKTDTTDTTQTYIDRPSTQTKIDRPATSAASIIHDSVVAFVIFVIYFS